MVHAESVMFLAIAVALLVIAVVVFVRGVHDLVLAPPGSGGRRTCSASCLPPSSGIAPACMCFRS